jgi:uncharacterized FlgJ-related protein
VNTIPRDYLNSIEPVHKTYVNNYDGLINLWEGLGYTHETWVTGVREIPRVYLISVGENWGAKTSKEISTLNKKRVFFRAIAPLVIRANELISMDRKILLNIKMRYKSNSQLSEVDYTWISKISKTYKLHKNEDAISNELFLELEAKVDVIPVSLALAQAAVESGWGTSRFTHVGNSIFGQWSWGDDAIKPEEQRTHLGDYGIASFSSLQESVCAYMLNINTHGAYQKLREIRSFDRNNNQKLSGKRLADGLIRYSERGQTYVDEIKSMIGYNHLESSDVTENTTLSYDDDALVGIMQDGFFLYGRKCNSTGDHPTDLDSSGGHTSRTQHCSEEHYHYHIINEFYVNSYILLFGVDLQGTPNTIL